MAESNLHTPLLLQSNYKSSNHEPALMEAVAVTIENDVGLRYPDDVCEKSLDRKSVGRSQLEMDSPFGFLGVDGFSVPASSTIDPFRNDTLEVEGVYEWVKIVLCLPIALIRLVLFGLALLVGYLATLLALHRWKDRQDPMPKWRCRIMWVTRISARCILFSFGYQWIKRRGKPAAREIAPIVVSNHVSYIEPIFFFYELFPTIVASESHDSIPFVGTIIRAMQVIYVNRFSPLSRKQAVNEIKRKASCNEFPRLLLFPEGTTTNGRSLISFQLGAFIPGYPIQPVVVRYPHVHFDQSWGNISLGKLMFRMFTQFHNFMEVEYLPVTKPLENHEGNVFNLAEMTGNAMASALNVVQTSYSYGDALLLMKAAQMKQENPSRYMVEMPKVESVYHINTQEALEFLDKFLSMNPNNRGNVMLCDFLRVLGLKASSLSKKIFEFVDVEKRGSITFKQFLLASSCIMKHPSFRRACELAFCEARSRGNTDISKHELGDSIRLAIPEMNDDEVSELFMILDSDCDGKISEDDFTTSLRRNPLLIAIFSPLIQHSSMVSENGSEEMV